VKSARDIAAVLAVEEPLDLVQPHSRAGLEISSQQGDDERWQVGLSRNRTDGRMYTEMTYRVAIVGRRIRPSAITLVPLSAVLEWRQEREVQPIPLLSRDSLLCEAGSASTSPAAGDLRAWVEYAPRPSSCRLAEAVPILIVVMAVACTCASRARCGCGFLGSHRSGFIRR
jgi:hypothetical protein